MTTPATAADGTTIFRRTWDTADPKASMLIVHGLGEHSGRYDHAGAYFAGRGIATSAFDLRGFGQSEGHRAYVETFDRYLDDVEQQLAWAGRPGVPTVLLGHSLGGLIALSYAESDRSAPDLLVLSAPALAADVPVIKKVAAKLLSRVLPKLALPNDIEGEQLSRDPAVGEAYFADPLVHTKTTARLGAELFAAMDRAAARLDRLFVPAFVIHGGADTLVPPTASAPLANLANVQRRLFPQFRHECFNERDKEEALAAVADWVMEQAAALEGEAAG